MRNIVLIFLALGYILVLPQTAGAQKGYELGGWLGTSFYFGDLNTNLKITKPGPALGIMARYNFNNRISVRSTLSYGNVGADDANSENNFERNRNLSFRSNIFDLSNVIEFNFFKFEHGSRTYNKTPYFFGGFNIFRFSPTAKLNGQKYSLRDYGTEGQPAGQEYGQISGGLLLGGGFKFAVNRNLSINLEFSTRFLFTDYLDDVSTVYPDKALLKASRGDIAVALSDRSLSDGLGEAGRQRGDRKAKDQYTFVGISVMKYFGGIECPEISKIRN